MQETGSFGEFVAGVRALKPREETLWFGISGSWRKTSDEIQKRVRAAVRTIYVANGGIVSGGALSVDYFATDEAMRLDPGTERIRVYLPVTLERYAAHYRKRAGEGVITSQQAEALIAQLTELRRRNPAALIGNTVNTVVDPRTYHERNTAVVNASDALVAFQVNGSEGVEDTVQKALAQGKPVFRIKYAVE
jgi:hypothetical protein